MSIENIELCSGFEKPGCTVQLHQQLRALPPPLPAGLFEIHFSHSFWWPHKHGFNNVNSDGSI